MRYYGLFQSLILISPKLAWNFLQQMHNHLMSLKTITLFYFIDYVCLDLLDSDSLWQPKNNILLSAIIFREDWLLWTVIVAGCKLGFRLFFFVMLDILLPTLPGARG